MNINHIIKISTFATIQQPDPMTYIFKEYLKIVKIYLVKFNVTVFNRFKIMGFL